MLDEQDLARERLEWRLERVSWGLIGLVVLAGATGLVGPGPLTARHERADGLELSYPQCVHRAATAEWELRVDPAPGDGDDAVRLSFSGPWVDAVSVAQIEPPPLETTLQPGRLGFSFRRPRAGPLLVRLLTRCDEFGSLPGDVRAANGPAIPFRQFVFP